MQQPHAVFGATITCASCGAPFTPMVSGQTLCDKCHGLAHPEPQSPLQHAEVAGFKLVQELGAGRFAQSWVAEDAEGAPVVLKLLRRYAPDPNAVQRFLAEAQRLATADELEHPNLARPIAAGVHLVSAFFLVYQSGGETTLADELRQRGRVVPSRALELCAQIAEGLAVLHRARLLHLDLKPANVGVVRQSDGAEQAVLLDAVTSHLLSHIGLRDAAPLPLSTAAYMSPEEAAGKPPGPRSDLYALGVLLFQLVSGRLPMMGGTADELLRAHRQHPPLRLRDVGRRVHADLENLIALLLSKDPARRPAGGDELAAALRALIPIAEATPPIEAEAEGVDDPLPVALEPAPPPQMLPPAVDPDLERAMLGHVAARRPTPAPGIPKWAPLVLPRWWPLAAGALFAAAIAAAILIRSPAPSGPAQSPSVLTATPVAAPAKPASAPVVPAAVNEALRHKEEPLQDPAYVEQQPPRQVAPPSPGPHAKAFERAQKALWTGQAGAAQSILRDVLKKSGLSRRDRARASKLMGDAEARLGNRSRAQGWYRKSVKLYDDPDERAKVAKLLRQ